MAEINDITNAIVMLDGWFETMRGPLGYGGPVTHWWESNLLYCGPKFDWRYEGVIIGYLNLFDRTSDLFWLGRAIRAADDVCRAQMPSGNFFNSSFQQGPIEGGTPHEAAVDVALLELALRLKALDDARWHTYQQTAWRNLSAFHIEQLWNGHAFRDQPWNETYVPNKNATTMEALLLQQLLTGEDLEKYIASVADFILGAQVTDPSRPYLGGTVHLGTGRHQLVIGIYTARCASALVRLYEATLTPRYLKAAVAMGNYLLTLIGPNGTYFGHYPDGRIVTHPTWISPSGDILRALLLLRSYTDIPESAIEQLVGILVRNQQPTGGIPTSYGLARKGATGPVDVKWPDFRDVLSVVGWCDKAFRALTMMIDKACTLQRQELTDETELDCHYFRQPMKYREGIAFIELWLSDKNKCIYSYRKKESYVIWFP